MTKIILLNGPPAAGKSTVAKKFMESRANESWALLQHDEIRCLVAAGYASADAKRSEWDASIKSQWQLGAKNCVSLLRNFVDNEISVLVDFYAIQSEFNEVWKPMLEGLDYELVVLMPEKAMTINRNANRKEISRLTQGKIDEAYNDMTSWKSSGERVIDNSRLEVKDVIKLVDEVMP